MNEERDEPMENIDEAVDTMIACITVLEKNLPLLKADSVPQKAAKDIVKESLETGIKPYLYDLAKALEAFD